jgi:plastocyanin
VLINEIILYQLKKLLITSFFLLFGCNVYADDTEEIELKIENHLFYPSEVEVSSGKKIKLIVHNNDDTVEEFESHDLKREKIVPPGKKINIILAPLAPGKYEFFGDFHQDTAKGVINVR